MLRHVQLGLRCTGTTPRNVQTCSLCSPYCRQAGSWHSTEMPSCLSCQMELHLRTSRCLELCIRQKQPITPNLLGFSVNLLSTDLSNFLGLDQGSFMSGNKKSTETSVPEKPTELTNYEVWWLWRGNGNKKVHYHPRKWICPVPFVFWLI